MDSSLTESKRCFTCEDIFKVKTLLDPQIAPDGTKVAFTVRSDDAENSRYRSDIWIVETDGSSGPVNISGDGESRMTRWAPNSQDLVYISMSEGKQVVCVTNCRSEYRKILTDFSAGNISLGVVGETLAWSPDGSNIAYVASSEPAPAGTSITVISKMNYRAYTGYADMRRRHIFLVSPLGHQPPDQITFGDYDEHSICWSPDSREICFVSNRTVEGIEGYNYRTELWAIDIYTRNMRKITTDIGAAYQSDWSPDGKRIAFAAMKGEDTNNNGNSEDQHVWVVDSEGGEGVDLAAGLDRRCGPPGWMHDEKILFLAQDHGSKKLYQVSPDGGPAALVLDGNRYIDGYGSRISVARDCEKIAYISNDPTDPGEVCVANIDGSDERRLTGFNSRLLEEVYLSGLEEFYYKSFDDTEIQGWLMKPPDFDSSKKYPLLLNVHGGPHQMGGYLFSDRSQLLASGGYVVAHINCRGSTGYGQEFTDGCILDPAGGDYEDYMVGVDYLLSKYGYLDGENMGVWGHRYGGYMTNWIITHTDRFKAAVSISCISNHLSMYPNDAPGWSDTILGGEPWDRMELYLERSPIMYVKDAKTPTLYLHGLADSSCPSWQSEEMFMALKHMRVDTAMVLYEDSGHEIDASPEHYVDHRRRTVAWFDKYLKGRKETV
jgi:dipeptidyl aminopeptidase/acylaminoacyl peptidase